MLKHIIKASLAIILIGGLAYSAADKNPCLKEGKTKIEANPNLKSDGIPVGGEVIDGPKWFDDDFASEDQMGEGNPIEVENKKGNISGPNGKVVNGGLDGDCIELRYRVKIRYPLTVTVTVEPGGIGGSGTTTVWASYWQTFTHGEWCPC